MPASAASNRERRQSSCKLLRKRYDPLENTPLLLPLFVLDNEPEPGLIEIKSSELGGIEEEFWFPADEPLVLNVPPPRSLLMSEPCQPLFEHLPSADSPRIGVVAKQKLHREDTALAELDVMPAEPYKIELRRGLPAFQLEVVEVFRVLIESKVGSGIDPLLESVIDRAKLEYLKVDAVEAECVDALDCMLQVQPRPRPLANLVGVVVDVPARRILARNLLLAQENRLPVEGDYPPSLRIA